MSSRLSIGSLEGIDRVDEDINLTRSSRATGYMGKSSEVTWLQRSQGEAEQSDPTQAAKSKRSQNAKPVGGEAIHTMNYHLDDQSLTVAAPVQSYGLPSTQVANHLFNDYMDTVDPSFPIIDRNLLHTQYSTFFDSATWPCDKWLAILNAIFAIAAKHAHLTGAPWRGDSQDHLIFLTRARALGMSEDVLFDKPDLRQIQLEGLIAFYLLSSGQVNRHVSPHGVLQFVAVSDAPAARSELWL
ncbi:C6 transcription factor [Penicillium citrinum]|uniref:C6 transcription factor n=1 Tax=Penicillium citrinum TaxID=5077 RepID=A0A9W9TUJ5_PENCI|nr:C6 transcription factor [Penicillium citrinum]KAJ5241748.1 C6 transcription factor [Penicillium citrinum]